MAQHQSLQHIRSSLDPSMPIQLLYYTKQIWAIENLAVYDQSTKVVSANNNSLIGYKKQPIQFFCQNGFEYRFAKAFHLKT